MSSITSPTLRSACPILPVSDIDRSIGYYETVLGFRLGWKWGAPPSHASVCRDEIEFMLELRPELGAVTPGKVYVTVQGIDAYYARVVAAGADVAYPLATRDYGMRDCRVIDPDGNELSFGESQA